MGAPGGIDLTTHEQILTQNRNVIILNYCNSLIIVDVLKMSHVFIQPVHTMLNIKILLHVQVYTCSRYLPLGTGSNMHKSTDTSGCVSPV